ncbi:MAG: endolytic transglycosylase MltG [Coxiellaceae bacterium]|nr:endolytic transglycosylase MltG [Coxiellaceae bacterium]
MSVRRISICLMFVVAIAVVYWFVYLAMLQSYVRPVTVKVYRGDSLRTLSRRLKMQGLEPYPIVFEWYGRLMGDSHSLKHGEYQVNVNDTARDLLNKIVDGDVLMREFVIIEGWTYKQVMSALRADPHLLHYLRRMKTPELMKKLKVPHDSLEGLLFPDTYAYTWGDSDIDLIKRAYDRMQKELTDQWSQRAKSLPYKDAYQALIMASLIEKETAVENERREIAGVLVRRLNIRMRLQVDPTVVYGMKKPYGAKITRKDLKTPTPYNTYTNYGLPPTPIDMPGLPSINAALHPAEGTTLYYVSKNDGSHKFSDTYVEHKEAVDQWQRPPKS